MSKRALPSMRTFSRTLFLSVITLLLPTIPALGASSVPPEFTFQGSGFGHGVGMSQTGALGMAREGKTAMEILRYYYSAVTVEPMVDSQMMRVNIGHALTAFSIKDSSQTGQLKIFQGDVQDSDTAEPAQTLTPDMGLSFTILGNLVLASVSTPDGQVTPLPSSAAWTIRWTGTRYLSGPTTIVSTNIAGKNTRYRYGQIQVKSVKSSILGYRLEVTNTVRLHDEYLWGIGEMPSSWPLAALQAQAIASRTYAMSRAGVIKSACDCNVYSASTDQAFVGYSKEVEKTWGPLWKAAVTSTSTDSSTGLTILYKASPISAYFFSSSGGVTESAKNAWGSAVPYALSVPDPWSLDPKINSKYAHWVRTASQSVVAAAFGLPDVVNLVIASKRETGTVASIIATSSTGATVVLKGTIFTSRAKLPSPWFDVVDQQAMAPAPTPTPTPTVTS